MTGNRELPLTQVQDYLGEPVEGEDVVEFVLLHYGRVLGSSKEKTRADLKHEIRREFHPQLRRLWQSSTNLQTLATAVARDDAFSRVENDDLKGMYAVLQESTRPDLDYYSKGISLIANKWERFGYKFVPLITEEFCLRCSLEILFLRPEEPGLLIRSGDIDARIKTIFDALRLPKNLGETDSLGPRKDEDPFYCLLEDDKLVSEIRVTTDQLLLLPKEKELNANDAFLVIRVKLKSTQKNRWDWAFS